MGGMSPILLLLLGGLGLGAFHLLSPEEEDDTDSDSDDKASGTSSVNLDDGTEYQGNGTNEVFMTGGGSDTVYGGAGADSIGDLELSEDEYIALVNGDYDDLTYAERLEFMGLDTGRDAADDDLFNGGAGNDALVAYWGSDTLFGGDGDDYLDAVDWSVTGGSDSVSGGAGNDRLELDNGDVASGGAGEDHFRNDGFWNTVPDLAEAPVVIQDFDPTMDSASYWVNSDEDDNFLIPTEAALIAVQVGDDVHVGANIPDADGVFDGALDFTMFVMEASSQADIDTAIERERIYREH